MYDSKDEYFIHTYNHVLIIMQSPLGLGQNLG